MDRLTARIDDACDELDEIAFINPDDPEGLYNLRDIVKYSGDERLYKIADRLAAYEDIGLTPDQIRDGTKVTFDIGDEGFLTAINAAFRKRFGIIADDVPKLLTELDELRRRLTEIHGIVHFYNSDDIACRMREIFRLSLIDKKGGPR